MVIARQQCPNCACNEVSVFYAVSDVPVNSVVLLPTPEEAFNFPTGDVKLGFCSNCGFITNTVFDPTLIEYSTRYDSTQGFSAGFNAYHRDLAQRLIDQYDLTDKTVIEIGCGQGEFLELLCELGHNRGIGFDPTYTGQRSLPETADLTFINDFYSEQYGDLKSDFVCCKMTLEHIAQTAEFVGMVRRTLGNATRTLVFFQVPDVTRVLQEHAFWDIYYEHCSYFNPESLAYLFRHCGFDIVDLRRDFGDQYLSIIAQPAAGGWATQPRATGLDTLTQTIADFDRNSRRQRARWREQVCSLSQAGKKIVIWGASSKGVSFLTTLQLRDEIEYAIDINPHKWGTYIAGTGQRIESPEFLCTYQPDVVIVMNPIYRQEIQQQLDHLSVKAELMTIE